MKRYWLISLALLNFACSSEVLNEPAAIRQLVTNCPPEDSTRRSAVPSKIESIKHGSSFGECSGYCITESTYDGNHKITRTKAWGDTIINPTKTTITKISASEWELINNSFDLDSFLALPKRIGCPDCRDGGARWVEVSQSGRTHTVTFEYLSPPKELLELLELIGE